MLTGQKIQLYWGQVTDPFVVEPYNLRKRLEFRGEKPEVVQGAEWICRVISDSHPHMHQVGKIVIAFVEVVREKWVLEPVTPKLYGCQRVEPQLKRGIREMRERLPDPPPEMAQVADVACREYRAALVRARQELAPYIAGHKGLGDVTIDIDLPGLRGKLHSSYFVDRGRDCGLSAFSVNDTLEQESDALYSTWTFQTEGGECYIGRTPLVTGLYPGSRSILDLEQTVQQLGQPTGCGECFSEGLELIWGHGKGRMCLILHGEGHFERLLERRRELGLAELDLVEIKEDPTTCALRVLDIRDDIKRLLEAKAERERKGEDARRSFEEAEAKRTMLSERAMPKPKPPVLEVPATTSSASVSDLQQRFNRRK